MLPSEPYRTTNSRLARGASKVRTNACTLRREPPEGETMFLREPTHILLIVLVLILLFGAKRLPDSARALGRSLRIFKGELKSNQVEGKGEISGDTKNQSSEPNGEGSESKKPE